MTGKIAIFSTSCTLSPECLLISAILFTPWFFVVSAAADVPKLLLMSFDGFKWSYIDKLPKSRLPNFHKFIDNGVRVQWIENVFPTVTRPNHMSMVSGLYSESHGVVQNAFFDPVLNYSMPDAGQLGNNVDDYKMVDAGAEPIWVTNSKENQRQSGCILWPCADVKIKGRMPEEIKKGEWSVSEEKFSAYNRTNLALEWLTNPKNPVNFVAVYFNEPDEVSHKYGPDSQEVLDVILQRDLDIQYLMDQIEKNGLNESLNVIITADHGHLGVYPETEINIDLLVNPDWYTSYPDFTYSEPMVNIWPKSGYLEKLVSDLQHINLHVLTEKDSDELQALHYFQSKRIAPIVLYAEPGWVMITNRTIKGSRKGQHGWDPRYSVDMYPFFIATGPAFKKGLQNAAPFHMVDIYPLMCYILGLQPAPNNGSLENTRHILAERALSPIKSNQKPSYIGVAVGIIVVILAVVMVVVVLWKIRQNQNVTASYKRSFAQTRSTDELMQDDAVNISDEELMSQSRYRPHSRKNKMGSANTSF